MNKGCLKKLLIGILICFGLLIIGAKWFFTQAFGPKTRTVKIEVNNIRTLICKETYNADFASVFYDVDFTLEDKKNGAIGLGEATFSKKDWNKHITFNEIDNWFIILVDQGSWAKILMSNQDLKLSTDTMFSPLDLRYDTLWQSKYKETPASVYTGYSRIDSMVNENIYINYFYRLGINKPFKFYNQTIEYEMDLKKGEFITKKIFERIEK